MSFARKVSHFGESSQKHVCLWAQRSTGARKALHRRRYLKSSTYFIFEEEKSRIKVKYSMPQSKNVEKGPVKTFGQTD